MKVFAKVLIDDWDRELGHALPTVPLLRAHNIHNRSPHDSYSRHAKPPTDEIHYHCLYAIRPLTHLQFPPPLASDVHVSPDPVPFRAGETAPELVAEVPFFVFSVSGKG